jgi:hypothetical protein
MCIGCLNKFSLVSKKTDLQMDEVCQPDDAALPNQKTKQNKIERTSNKNSKPISMLQLNNKSKKLQQTIQVTMARNKIYVSNRDK